MNLRRPAIILCVADMIVAGLIVNATLLRTGDPATASLDFGAGLLVLGLLSLTVLPAAILLWRRKSEKLAFAFSLGFPGLIVALGIAAIILFA